MRSGEEELLALFVQTELDGQSCHAEIGGGEALVEATQALLLVDAANAIQGARVGQTLSLHLVGLQLEPRLDQPDGRDHGRRHHACDAGRHQVEAGVFAQDGRERSLHERIGGELHRARGDDARQSRTQASPHAAQALQLIDRVDALEGAAQEAAGALHEQLFVVARLETCADDLKRTGDDSSRSTANRAGQEVHVGTLRLVLLVRGRHGR